MENGGDQGTKKPGTAGEHGSNGGNGNQGEHCKVCKGAHAISKCSVFLPKGVGLRRRLQGLSLFATDVCLTLICKGTAQKRPVVLTKTVLVHKITTRW